MKSPNILDKSTMAGTTMKQVRAKRHEMKNINPSVKSTWCRGLVCLCVAPGARHSSPPRQASHRKTQPEHSAGERDTKDWHECFWSLCRFACMSDRRNTLTLSCTCSATYSEHTMTHPHADDMQLSGRGCPTCELTRQVNCFMRDNRTHKTHRTHTGAKEDAHKENLLTVESKPGCDVARLHSAEEVSLLSKPKTPNSSQRPPWVG